jgi:hypothetical protein
MRERKKKEEEKLHNSIRQKNTSETEHYSILGIIENCLSRSVL